MRSEKLGADELEDLLNHQSGLFALSSGESDVKALEERARSNDPQAALALDVFAISVRKVIGAYVALLGGVDLLVFTGGIGEHSDYVRSLAASGLEFLGLTPDKIQDCLHRRRTANRAPLSQNDGQCSLKSSDKVFDPKVELPIARDGRVATPGHETSQYTE